MCNIASKYFFVFSLQSRNLLPALLLMQSSYQDIGVQTILNLPCWLQFSVINYCQLQLQQLYLALHRCSKNMFGIRRVYTFLILSMLIVACQKEPIVSNKDYQTLGTSAHDLLTSSVYTSLRIEISYMPGYAPDAVSLNNLTQFLQKYLNKPGGIQVFLKAIGPSNQSNLKLSDLVSIEQKNRVEFTSNNTIGVHILIADADYSDTEDLAIAYWNTSFCLFGKKIWESSGTPGQISRTNLLSTLLKHEFGHLLGLVDQGSPQQSPHRDENNGAHCSNTDCLMYHLVETNTSSNVIPELDADCILDLKANGSK